MKPGDVLAAFILIVYALAVIGVIGGALTFVTLLDKAMR